MENFDFIEKAEFFNLKRKSLETPYHIHHIHEVKTDRSRQIGQDRQVKTRQTGQDRQVKTGRSRQTGQDRQVKTGRSRQTGQDRQVKTDRTPIEECHVIVKQD